MNLKSRDDMISRDFFLTMTWFSRYDRFHVIKSRDDMISRDLVFAMTWFREILDSLWPEFLVMTWFREKIRSSQKYSCCYQELLNACCSTTDGRMHWAPTIVPQQRCNVVVHHCSSSLQWLQYCIAAVAVVAGAAVMQYCSSSLQQWCIVAVHRWHRDVML